MTFFLQTRDSDFYHILNLLTKYNHILLGDLYKIKLSTVECFNKLEKSLRYIFSLDVNSRKYNFYYNNFISLSDDSSKEDKNIDNFILVQFENIFIAKKIKTEEEIKADEAKFLKKYITTEIEDDKYDTETDDIDKSIRVKKDVVCVITFSFFTKNVFQKGIVYDVENSKISVISQDKHVFCNDLKRKKIESETVYNLYEKPFIAFLNAYHSLMILDFNFENKDVENIHWFVDFIKNQTSGDLLKAKKYFLNK